MNKNKIRNYQIFSCIFVFILGTLLHFTYDWSNGNSIVATFSSVNESTWEHLKLLFFPTLITIVIGVLFFKNDFPNFLCSKTIGIIVALLFTIIFFYTYAGILGRNIAIIDVSSFFISATLGEFVSYVLIVNHFKCNSIIAILVLLLLLTLFIVFTFNPPKIGLFKDPITNKYGIIKK